MLIQVTTLSTFGGSAYPLVDSLLGLKASKGFIVNGDNIVKYKLYDTDDTYMRYKLNKNDDEAPEFSLIVDEANATIKTACDATPASNLITLSVYEGALTFGDVANISSTTDIRFNVSDIVWGIDDETPTATMILVEEGGFTIRKYFVSQTLEEIIDIADTGTTTTTTSTTSTTGA